MKFSFSLFSLAVAALPSAAIASETEMSDVDVPNQSDRKLMVSVGTIERTDVDSAIQSYNPELVTQADYQPNYMPLDLNLPFLPEYLKFGVDYNQVTGTPPVSLPGGALMAPDLMVNGMPAQMMCGAGASNCILSMTADDLSTVQAAWVAEFPGTRRLRDRRLGHGGGGYGGPGPRPPPRPPVYPGPPGGPGPSAFGYCSTGDLSGFGGPYGRPGGPGGPPPNEANQCGNNGNAQFAPVSNTNFIPISIICFSGHSKVDVKDKGTTLMKDLKVGDQVLTSSGDYQPIYSFMHYHETLPTKYLQIHTTGLESKDPLEISEDHLLFLAGHKNPVPASEVKVGDKLVAGNNALTTVSKIKEITRSGLYAPATTDGTIVVNGVKASSFVTFQKGSESLMIGGYKVISYHLLAHMWEMPHRLYCSGFGSDFCKDETHNEQGFSQWSSFGLILVGALDLTMFIPAIIFVVLMSVLGPLYAMEWMVMNAPGTMMTAMTLVGTWYYLKKHFAANIKALKTVE